MKNCQTCRLRSWDKWSQPTGLTVRSGYLCLFHLHLINQTLGNQTRLFLSTTDHRFLSQQTSGRGLWTLLLWWWKKSKDCTCGKTLFYKVWCPVYDVAIAMFALFGKGSFIYYEIMCCVEGWQCEWGELMLHRVVQFSFIMVHVQVLRTTTLARAHTHTINYLSHYCFGHVKGTYLLIRTDLCEPRWKNSSPGLRLAQERAGQSWVLWVFYPEMDSG